MFSGGGGGMGMGGGGFGSHMGQFLGGLFGGSDEPYKDAMKQYQEWANRAQGVQDPYLQMGNHAIPQFQQWLGGMQDPTAFINNMMGGYKESPFAKYQQQQGMRAAQNMGSGSGMTGSTPQMQFAQQQAKDISSKDMQDWLGRVLGINSMYGSGLQNEINGGQNAANSLTNMYGDMGRQMGEAAYGRRAGRNQDRNNLWGGWLGMGGDMLGAFM